MTLPATDFNNEVTYAGRSYFLRNVHFHTPQEHKVNGKNYPVEFHFVHSLRNAKPGDVFTNLVIVYLGKQLLTVRLRSALKM